MSMIDNCETASQITQMCLLSLGGKLLPWGKKNKKRERELHKSHQFMNSGETKKGLQKPYVWEEQAWGWFGSQEAAQYGAPFHYLWPGTCAAQALSTCLHPMFSACDNPRFPIKALSTLVSLFSTWVSFFPEPKILCNNPRFPVKALNKDFLPGKNRYFQHLGLVFCNRIFLPSEENHP